MKKILSILLIALVVIFTCSISGASNDLYLIVEGLGIKNIAFIGDNIKDVKKKIGKPDRSVKEDWPYSPYYFHEYQIKGILFQTDEDGKILNITVYCNTGNKEKYHKTGLMWINPSSVYSTFKGRTSEGLTLKDKLAPEDVYKVYGVPSIKKKLGIDIKEQISKSKAPFILDMKKAGFTIYYPERGISFNTFNGLVESFTIASVRDE